jgi:hypothetical protein
MKPQSAEVLHLLRIAGPKGITQQDAITMAQCYRLAARIADLKADGFPIAAELVTREGVRFSRYRLLEPPRQMDAGL